MTSKTDGKLTEIQSQLQNNQDTISTLDAKIGNIAGAINELSTAVNTMLNKNEKKENWVLQNFKSPNFFCILAPTLLFILYRLLINLPEIFTLFAEIFKN